MEDINNLNNENKELSMKDMLDKIYKQTVPEEKKGKIRKIKIPRKARVSKSKQKKGWVGFLFLNESGCVSGEKVKVEGGTFKLKDGNYRYTDGHEMIRWLGKYPLYFQRYDKTNPTNFFEKETYTKIIDKDGNEKIVSVNEVYGQDEIMLRMKRDVIKEKKGMNITSLLIIGALLVGGYFVIKMFFPKLFGG